MNKVQGISPKRKIHIDYRVHRRKSSGLPKNIKTLGTLQYPIQKRSGKSTKEKMEEKKTS